MTESSLSKTKTKTQIGAKFGYLTIIAIGEPYKRGKRRWVCQCKCGNQTLTHDSHLQQGKANSCGCLTTENRVKVTTKHGLCGTKTYQTWNAMLERCRNPKHVGYSNYGGRGIEVCERWKSFENFLADMGERPKGKTIDRINSNGNYEPSNCQWQTNKQQHNNRNNNRNFTIKGVTKTLTEWCEYYKTNRMLVDSRINKYGWDIVKALTTPPLWNRKST
jgi:hypothetical protein